MKFEDNKVYASCFNPNGFLALPVGQVWVRTTEWCSPVMNTDEVYGSDLNKLIEKYENIIAIIFVSDNGQEILYQAY